MPEAYEVQNTKNLLALINAVQKNPKPNTIAYQAAQRYALLGAGHAKSDVSVFNPNDCYKGTIAVTVTASKSTLTKKSKVTELLFTIDGKLHQGGKVVKQMADRAELQFAIRDALAETEYKGVPTKYTWA
jgi:hypothetical protein